MRRPKHQAPETNAATRLLEADKKRLLAQPDWVGIHSSKPVRLQFVSCEQKAKIGKRRITTDSHGTAKKRKVDRRWWREDPDLQRDVFAACVDDGVARSKGEDIRIRIGTDALTETRATQLHGEAQSHASSEPMLLEQDGLTSGRVEFINAEHVCDRQVKVRRAAARVTLGERAGSTLGSGLAHGAHSDDGAQRLVSSGLHSGTSIRTYSASNGREEEHETKQHRRASLPRASQVKGLHHVAVDRSKADADAYAIMGQEAWMRHLALSDDRSVGHEGGIGSRDAVQRTKFDTSWDNEAATKWSQHVCAGRDDDRHTGGRSISESLPSVRRGVWKPIPGRALEDAIRQGDAPLTNWRNSDQDERNWQAFVLGGGLVGEIRR